MSIKGSFIRGTEYERKKKVGGVRKEGGLSVEKPSCRKQEFSTLIMCATFVEGMFNNNDA